MQIFISYSRVDKEFALALIDRLNEYMVTVWFDLRNIPHGANWDMEVQKGLDASDVLLVLLSPDSAVSENVADEWSFFISKDKPVLPLMVRPCEVPFRLSRRQRVDFTGNFETAFTQLIRALGNPQLLDPDETAKVRAVQPSAPAVSAPPPPRPASLPPSSIPAGEAGKAARSAPAAESKPSKPGRATITEVALTKYPVLWGTRYHWFNGMIGSSDGDLMINSREIMLVPRRTPIQVIPFNSVISATIQRAIDPHLKIRYTSSDGRTVSLRVMGIPPRRRKAIAEEIVKALKAQTGKALE
jgi:hypothetical protein